MQRAGFPKSGTPLLGRCPVADSPVRRTWRGMSAPISGPVAAPVPDPDIDGLKCDGVSYLLRRRLRAAFIKRHGAFYGKASGAH